MEQNYFRDLEFAFAHLINYCSKNLTSEDLDMIIPLLHFSADNGNFEAGLILALYFDPVGCLFNDFPKHERHKSQETALKFYRRTYELSKLDGSERARRVVILVEETLNAASSLH
jgi:hypothetical protein